MATHSQYSFLGNPMDRGTWRATVHGVTKTWTQSPWTQLSTRLHFNSKGSGYNPGHRTKTHKPHRMAKKKISQLFPRTFNTKSRI